MTSIIKVKKIREVHLQVNGIHNVYNSLSAIATGFALGLDIEAICLGLYNFTGTQRRFEYKGDVRGVHVIDDYAHHPTEIETTLTAANKYPHDKLWVVFSASYLYKNKSFIKRIRNITLLG